MDLAQVGTKLNRVEVTDQEISIGISHLVDKLKMRLEQKGYGAYASRHEILGILAEEYKEVIDAIQLDYEDGYVQFKKELLDVAVGAIFGYICMQAEHISAPNS